jgi:hypothetical protein
MNEEPDIFFSGDGIKIAQPTLDLSQYTEEEFRLHYKGTKKQYTSLIEGIQKLADVHAALSENGPLEIDSDIITNIEYLVQDFVDVLEQMHLAAEWEKENH